MGQGRLQGATMFTGALAEVLTARRWHEAAFAGRSVRGDGRRIRERHATGRKP